MARTKMISLARVMGWEARFPSVLVVKEKHGDWYVHIPNEATLYRVALKILKERFKSGDWYYEQGPVEVECEHPGFSEADIAKMPSSLQDIATEKLRGYNSRVLEYKREGDLLFRIKEALKEKDGYKAWRVLQSRSGYEYERMELVEYSKGY